MQGLSQDLDFERGPIRPPSEAASLFFRIVRNCPWNRCAFCPVYKGMKFQKRSMDELLSDIETAGIIAEEIRSFARSRGYSEEIPQSVVLHILRQKQLSDAYKSVAVWLHRGGQTIFLQDADPLVLKTSALEQVLHSIIRQFPSVRRITAYSRSVTTYHLGVHRLRILKDAGLNRIHTGLESGSDAVLSQMKKGVQARHHIEGGRNVRSAGLELSLYVMPGLGGAERWRDHAISSAEVVSAIEPDFIRLRTLAIPPRIPLYELWREGRFQTLDEDHILREIRLFLEHLSVSVGRLESDHIVNLLSELEGDLPGDIPRMIQLIDRYLALPEPERLLFQIGRRTGVFQTLGDLDDPWRRNAAESYLYEMQSNRIDPRKALRSLMMRFV